MDTSRGDLSFGIFGFGSKPDRRHGRKALQYHEESRAEGGRHGRAPIERAASARDVADRQWNACWNGSER